MVALAVLSVGSHLGRPATPPLFPTSRQHPVPRSRRRTVRATDSKFRDESGTSARQFTRSAWVGTRGADPVGSAFGSGWGTDRPSRRGVEGRGGGGRAGGRCVRGSPTTREARAVIERFRVDSNSCSQFRHKRPSGGTKHVSPSSLVVVQSPVRIQEPVELRKRTVVTLQVVDLGRTGVGRTLPAENRPCNLFGTQ